MQNIKHVVSQLASLVALLIASGSLSGCITTSGAAFGAASGAMAAQGVGNDFKYYVFDVPPQVIYRIDDHRFFTLENYKDCDHGGLAYYNDTRKKIKKYIGGGSDSNSILEPNPVIFWQGGFVYAASDNVIAYPKVRHSYSDRELDNGVYLYHSVNGYKKNIYMSSDYYRGEGISVFVDENDVYIKRKLRGEHLDIEKYHLPFNGNEDSYDVVIPSKIISPSSDTRFTCDRSIKPVNIKTTKKQIYAVDATGVPEHE